MRPQQQQGRGWQHRGGSRPRHSHARGPRQSRQPWNNRGRGRGNTGNNRPDFIEELGEPSSSSDRSISVAVEGCCHGELDAIYERLLHHQQATGRTIDLLICCGDFQSLRNTADFHSLAVPPKYRALGSFYKYYSGEKEAPFLTVFVGGNHEASQPLRELFYGGWVAPNIYYLGAAGVVQFAGVRIGGISGIYKSHDYHKGYFERPPFDKSTLRSVYHVREADVHRLKCLGSDEKPLDMLISHDWPLGIEQHGDTQALLRMKPFFRDEVQRNELGSPPNGELLRCLKPKWWFAAHLHVKFKATVRHDPVSAPPDHQGSVTQLVPSQAIHNTVSPQKEKSGKDAAAAEGTTATTFVGVESSDPCQGPDLTSQMTQFLAMDKCLPRRLYLSIVHIPVSERTDTPRLEYDLEWLAILRKTHHLMSSDPVSTTIPSEVESVTAEEMEWVRQRMGSSLEIPDNFERTVPAHMAPPHPLPRPLPPPLPNMGNPQTDCLLSKLGLSHVVTIPYESPGGQVEASIAGKAEDENEIDLSGGDSDDDDLGAMSPSKRVRL